MIKPCLKSTRKIFLFVFLLYFLLSFNLPASVFAAGTIATEQNFKVAFIGDSGDGEGHRKVMQLIANEDVDLVIHSGDFSYSSGPTSSWTSNISQSIKSTVPYLGSDGNHDDWAKYAPFFENQLSAHNIKVLKGSVSSGNYAVEYKGLYMIFTKEGGDTNFAKDTLPTSNNIWKICSEHQNRKDFQAGGKSDQVSLSFFEECLKEGAIVVNGHEHSYARTLTMSDLSSSGRNNYYGAQGVGNQMNIQSGNTYKGFVLVNGASGVGLRNYSTSHDSDAWWSTIYAGGRYCKNNCTDLVAKKQNRNNDIDNVKYDYVAAFIEFNPNGNTKVARGYTKSVEGCQWGSTSPCGKLIDEYSISVDGTSVPVTPTPIPTPTNSTTPTPTPKTTPNITPLPGNVDRDLNKDGQINVLDILTLLAFIF